MTLSSAPDIFVLSDLCSDSSGITDSIKQLDFWKGKARKLHYLVTSCGPTA